MRSTHHIGPSALHPMTPSSPAAHTIEVAPLEESDEDPSDMMLESEMNDMVEAIFEATDPTADDMKQEARLVTSGYHACAICGPGLNARYSSVLKKMIYSSARGRMVRYPPELEVLPRFMPLLWLHQQLTKAEEEGVHVSLEE
ncbi:hypothetical protein L7F22_015757 [Adiantum nelumboides]|nr:hypothetical protein [Adiantum nelumboides]